MIEGILPLARIRSFLFGDSLSSLPFCVSGGVVAANPAAEAALEARAIALARELQVDHLEFRNLAPRHLDWPRKDQLYVNFRKELDPDPEKNMLAIPRKQRAMVRKGIEAGLLGEIDRDVARFYPAYSESVRNLGTPVFSKKYFEILREVFGPDCEVLTITQNGRLIASVLSFYFRDQVLPYYGGGTAAAREVKGNDFMYWELMRRATRARGADLRLRPQQARYRRLQLQEKLGLRTRAAALRIRTGARPRRCRTSTRSIPNMNVS